MMSDIKQELQAFADFCRSHEDYQVMDLIDRTVAKVAALEETPKNKELNDLQNQLTQLKKLHECVVLESCEKSRQIGEFDRAAKNCNDAAAIGFTHAYMCIEADKGNDVRQIEVPRIFEAWKEAIKK